MPHAIDTRSKCCGAAAAAGHGGGCFQGSRPGVEGISDAHFGKPACGRPRKSGFGTDFLWRASHDQNGSHRILSHDEAGWPLVARGPGRGPFPLQWSRCRRPATNIWRQGRFPGEVRQQDELGHPDNSPPARTRLHRRRRLVGHRRASLCFASAGLHARSEFHGQLRSEARRHLFAARPHRLPGRLHLRFRS